MSCQSPRGAATVESVSSLLLNGMIISLTLMCVLQSCRTA